MKWSGTIRFRSTVNVEKINSTGGGTVWMDQPAGDEVLPTGSSFFSVIARSCVVIVPKQLTTQAWSWGKEEVVSVWVMVSR